jgi:hypothetical protein
VQARLRPGIAPISEAADNWLPLYWTPGYTARIPRALISALAAFAGNRLESELADWLRRQGPIEYEASGVVQETTVSATLGSGVLGGVCGTTALTGLFLAVGWGDWAIPAIVADVILIGVGINRLGTRAARKKLPPGPWSLRVHAEAMEITRAGRSIRLTSDEVENIELRPVRGSSWGSAVHARLRSQSATPIGTSDAWFLIYWEQNLSTTIAPELVISLAGFAPGRLSGQLKGQLERARGPKAPVYREGRAAAQRAQAPATPGSGP